MGLTCTDLKQTECQDEQKLLCFNYHKVSTKDVKENIFVKILWNLSSYARLGINAYSVFLNCFDL